MIWMMSQMKKYESLAQLYDVKTVDTRDEESIAIDVAVEFTDCWDWETSSWYYQVCEVGSV